MERADLTREQVAELTARLEQSLAALGGDIDAEREEARDNVGSRRPSGVQDRGEESFVESVAEVDRALLIQHEAARRDVQAALARIRDGSYGECLSCGDPIGYQRLAVSPAALRCVRCQERAERP